MIDSREEWKPIAGFENCYEISNHGNIRSKDRVETNKSGKQRKLKGKPIKVWSKQGFYSRASLQIGNVKKTFTVHRLVAEHFIPNPLSKLTVNHIDGNKSNPHVDNLEWATYNENMQHAFDIGLLENCTYLKGSKGEKHPYSKLTPVDILMIKCLSQNEFSNVQISKRFNVTENHIGMILKDKTWKHLTNTELTITL